MGKILTLSSIPPTSPDVSAGRTARELWWTSQELSPAASSSSSSPWRSTLTYHPGDEQQARWWPQFWDILSPHYNKKNQYSVVNGDTWIMNWEGYGRKQSWINFKVLSRHSPGGTEESHENFSQDSRFPNRDLKPGTSRIRSRRIRNTILWLLKDIVSECRPFLVTRQQHACADTQIQTHMLYDIWKHHDSSCWYLRFTLLTLSDILHLSGTGKEWEYKGTVHQIVIDLNKKPTIQLRGMYDSMQHFI
jgi:hypothetical protein